MKDSVVLETAEENSTEPFLEVSLRTKLLTIWNRLADPPKDDTETYNPSNRSIPSSYRGYTRLLAGRAIDVLDAQANNQSWVRSPVAHLAIRGVAQHTSAQFLHELSAAFDSSGLTELGELAITTLESKDGKWPVAILLSFTVMAFPPL